MRSSSRLRDAMANLSDTDREDIWREFMSQLSALHEPFTTPLTKADIRAAVDGLDAWLSANAASGNQSIPLPARTAMTAAQKARLQTLIVAKRWKVEPVTQEEGEWPRAPCSVRSMRRRIMFPRLRRHQIFATRYLFLTLILLLQNKRS